MRQAGNDDGRSLTMAAALVSAFRYLFFPAYLVVGTWATLRAEDGFVATVVRTGALAVLAGAERLVPVRPHWNYPFRDERRAAFVDLGTDLFYVVVVTRIIEWFLVLSTPFIVSSLGGWRASLGPTFWPSSLPIVLQVALLAVVTELASYWCHRAFHEWAPMWRFHAMHHYPMRMNVLKGHRQHPIDVITHSFLSVAVATLCGAPPEVVFYWAVIAALVADAVHSNIDVSNAVLGWVVTTPQYHAVHHSADLAESKSNFGCRIIVFDRLFGTFRADFADPRGAQVGVKPLLERGLARQLLTPFYGRMDDAGLGEEPADAG